MHKIIKIKSYFFENINIANKILTRFINKKETKTY